MKFQNNNLRPGCEPMTICVPKCFHTHYTEGRLALDGHTSPEPPESILVLQDMRSKQYKVMRDIIFIFNYHTKIIKIAGSTFYKRFNTTRG